MGIGGERMANVQTNMSVLMQKFYGAIFAHKQMSAKRSNKLPCILL